MAIDRATRVATTSPRVSFGVPVRDATAFLPRLLDSLQAQTFGDFEVVISDNDSTDATAALCRERAASDPRIRLIEQGRDIGQIENFNAVLAAARGDLFRWIGADDWLDPDYTARCVDALDARPDAIVATTAQDFVLDDGTRIAREYSGSRLDLADPGRRFRRVMWFFHADPTFLDPVYSMIRRSALESTRRLLVVPRTDQVLSAELALLGPFVHVPRCLSHRRRDPGDYSKVDQIHRRYHPSRHGELRETMRSLFGQFAGVLARERLGPASRLRCVAAVASHVFIVRTFRPLRRAVRRVGGRWKRRLLGAGGVG